MLNQLILKMEKKRNGLRAKVRINLPKPLVEFLQKKRCLTKFIDVFVDYLHGYINQEETLFRTVNNRKYGYSLLVIVTEKRSDKEFWIKLYNESLEHRVK